MLQIKAEMTITTDVHFLSKTDIINVITKKPKTTRIADGFINGNKINNKNKISWSTFFLLVL